MTVYVESNFVLEQSLQQEECDSCAELIDLASKGRILLAVPAFSLAEPHVATLGKEKARSRLSNDLRHQLFELGRSKPHRAVPATFETLASVLIASAQFERDGLRDTISRLLQTAEVISLDAAIVRSALEIQVEFGMSGQDAIVLASVLAHLDLSHRRRAASSIAIRGTLMIPTSARDSTLAAAGSLPVSKLAFVTLLHESGRSEETERKGSQRVWPAVPRISSCSGESLQKFTLTSHPNSRT